MNKDVMERPFLGAFLLKGCSEAVEMGRYRKNCREMDENRECQQKKTNRLLYINNEC